MKKTKFAIYLTIYMYICVVFATYSYYKIGKNYFTKDTTKNVSNTNNTNTSIKCNNDSLNLIIDSLTNIINTKSTLTANSTKLKFVKKCNDIFPIEESMIMDNDLEFNKYKLQYNSIISKTFKPGHLKPIKEILITSCEMFADENGENIVGECSTTNECSYIIYAAYGADEKTIIHEVCHSIYFINESLFNSKYKAKWLKINKYVSEYAKNSIYEDFAETGAYFLSNDIESNNPKFKLFKEFYDETGN